MKDEELEALAAKYATDLSTLSPEDRASHEAAKEHLRKAREAGKIMREPGRFTGMPGMDDNGEKFPLSPVTRRRSGLEQQRPVHREGSPNTPLSYRERVQGCLLAGAVGDALGAPVEFESIHAIRTRLGTAGATDLGAAYGGHGRITDDTQMTLFTLEGLIRAHVAARHGRGTTPQTAIHHAYLAEFGDHPPQGAEWTQRYPG